MLLPVKTHAKKSGPASHATIRLQHVLHVPDAVCNIIGPPILSDYNVVTVGGGGSITELSSNRQVAHFKSDARLFQVRLSGPPIGPVCGPSPFKPDVAYMLSVHWPESEHVKHMNPNDAPRHGTSSARGPQPPSNDDKLTPSEKKWLKDNYGGEFRFLRDHGLSIYKEEDRADGRTIVRSMMLHDEDEDEDEVSDGVSDAIKAFLASRMVFNDLGYDDDNDDDEEDNRFLAQMSLADHAFSSKQLAWIRAE